MRKMSSALVVGMLMLAVFIAGCSKAKEEPAPAAPVAKTPETPKQTTEDMILIPAGEFIFGTNKVDVCSPEQKVMVPAFYIDKYEVTMAEYLRFAVETGYQSQGEWRSLWAPEKANVPVVNITWDDAVAYAKWAGKRLPTEMEWEKAARGEKGFRYPWGDDWQGGRANTYEAGIKQPANVGSYAGDVSPYGVYDMLGNVMEWTADHFKPYKGNNMQHKDFGDYFRVVRGGDYAHYGGPVSGGQFHMALRGYYLPNAHFNFGFRCAKDATP